MKGLLKLTEDLGDVERLLELCTQRGVTIHHKREDLDLTADMVASGRLRRYGQARVGPGSTFGSRWTLVAGDRDVMKGAALEGLKICFVGTNWARPVEEQSALVKKLGGKVAKTAGPKVDVVVCAPDGEDTIDSPASTLPATLVIPEAVFQRVLPRPKKTSGPKARLGRDQRNLWRMMKVRDLDSVEQGLNLAASLDDPDTIDQLLDGVTVSPESGRLVLNTRFSGTGPAQPYLNYGLLGLLSMASPGSRAAELRAGVKRLTLGSQGLGGSDAGASALPSLKGFDALEHLSVALADGAQVADLRAWGPLPSLVELEVEPVMKEQRWGAPKVASGQLLSLDGLEAPALEEVRFRHSGLVHVDQLKGADRIRIFLGAHSPRLEHIDGLGGGSHLDKVEVQECPRLKRLDGICDSTAITEVSLTGCEMLESLEPLKGNTGLVKVDISSCRSLKSLEGLSAPSGLRIGEWRLAGDSGLGQISGCTSLTSVSALVALDEGVEDLTFWGCSALKDLSSLPPLPQIKHLQVSEAGGFESLEGVENLPGLTSVSLRRTSVTDLDPLATVASLERVLVAWCSELADATGLGDLPALRLVSLENCSSLVRLPETWSVQSLEGLNLAGCSSLGSIASLEQLTDLPAIGLQGSGITSLDGLAPHLNTQSVHIYSGRDNTGITSTIELPRNCPWSGPWIKPAVKGLEGLVLDKCVGLEDLTGLGDKPRPGVKGLSLVDCTGLKSLSGIDVFTGLRYLELGGNSALNEPWSTCKQAGLVVRVTVSGGAAFPEHLARTLSAVPGLRLEIHGTDLVDVSSLSLVKGLEALDLEKAPCVKDLTPLAGLAEFRALRAPGADLPRGFASLKEGGDDLARIRKLQRALCEARGQKLPPHLEEQKTAAPMAKDVKGAYRSLKKLLFSTDLQQIQQGVELLTAYGIPEVWDKFTEDFDATSGLISGWSSDDLPAMGKVFGKSRVKDQFFAHWSLFQVLASAPPEAEATCARREAVTQVHLTQRGYGDAPALSLGSLNLAGFNSLQDLYIGTRLSGADLVWLSGATALESVSLQVPELNDTSALGSLKHLRTLHLRASGLNTVAGLTDAEALEKVTLEAPGVTSLEGLCSPALNHLTLTRVGMRNLSGLESATGLESIHVEDCSALESLKGIEGATGLLDLRVQKCPNLEDVSAIGAMPLLGSTERETNSYYGRKSAGVLDLSYGGYLTDMTWLQGFTGPQSRLTTLYVKCLSGVDLSPIADVTGITDLQLQIRGDAGALVGLEHIERATITYEEAPSAVGEMPNLAELTLTGPTDFSRWPDLPALEKLKFKEGDAVTAWPSVPVLKEIEVSVSGEVSFADLRDQAVDTVTLRQGTLNNCKGLAGTGAFLTTPKVVVKSLDGLQGNQRLSFLSLRNFYGSLKSLEPLAEVSGLRVLVFGRRTGAEKAEPLLAGAPPLPQVITLCLGGYAGSLSHLAGWAGLKLLGLCDTGVLTGLEDVEALHKLEVVHLRGGDTKRDRWPESLQPRLDYKGSYDAHEDRRE